MLLSRSDDRFLSRRLLPNRTRGRGPAHCLRASHGGIFGFLGPGWKRFGYAASGVGFSRIEARRQVVCVRHALESALDHNRAAPVDLEATHASALEFVTLEELKAHG